MTDALAPCSAAIATQIGDYPALQMMTFHPTQPAHSSTNLARLASQVGDDQGQVIVDGPTDRKLAHALQDLFRESISVSRTFAYFSDQAFEPILA